MIVKNKIQIKSEILEKLSEYYILANTPYSLYEVIKKSDTNIIEYLHKDYLLEDLIKYFNEISTRKERTEISMGLSYAILIAILTHKQYNKNTMSEDLKAYRLRWGKEIESYINNISTNDNTIYSPIIITDYNNLTI